MRLAAVRFDICRGKQLCYHLLNRLGFAVLLRIDWLSHIAVAVIFGAIVYAIASSVAIERNKKQK
jgi:hypothetical protein